MAHQGIALARWRKEKGWSQDEAARRFGVTQAGWSPWETGAKTPDLDNALELEKFTGGAITAVGWAHSARRARARRRRAKATKALRTAKAVAA